MNIYKDEDGLWYYRSDGCGCCSTILSESCDEEIPVDWIEREIDALKEKILRCEEFLREKRIKNALAKSKKEEKGGDA
jgi:hypothetical protein